MKCSHLGRVSALEVKEIKARNENSATLTTVHMFGKMVGTKCVSGYDEGVLTVIIPKGSGKETGICLGKYPPCCRSSGD